MWSNLKEITLEVRNISQSLLWSNKSNLQHFTRADSSALYKNSRYQILSTQRLQPSTIDFLPQRNQKLAIAARDPRESNFQLGTSVLPVHESRGLTPLINSPQKEDDRKIEGIPYPRGVHSPLNSIHALNWYLKRLSFIAELFRETARSGGCYTQILFPSFFPLGVQARQLVPVHVLRSDGFERTIDTLIERAFSKVKGRNCWIEFNRWKNQSRAKNLTLLFETLYIFRRNLCIHKLFSKLLSIRLV